jgi:arginine-tRNA-protein transferase
VHEIDFLRVVVNETNACSYLPAETARMPLSIPTEGVCPEQFDRLLAAGYRRSGWFFYRTDCPACSACQPLRLDVNQFQANRSQRRAWSKGRLNLQIQLAEPTVDQSRLTLFNQHRIERQLTHDEVYATASDYRSFLLNSYCEIVELSLWHEGKLIATSITDVGQDSLSAVYCFFDPAYSRFSPGTYAILQQIELARATSRRWLYLGMYVAANCHLNYKAKFAPHQRLIAGKWQNFPQPCPE